MMWYCRESNPNFNHGAQLHSLPEKWWQKVVCCSHPKTGAAGGIRTPISSLTWKNYAERTPNGVTFLSVLPLDDSGIKTGTPTLIRTERTSPFERDDFTNLSMGA